MSNNNDEFGKLRDEGAVLMREFKKSVASMRYQPNENEFHVMKSERKIVNLVKENEKLREEIAELRSAIEEINSRLSIIEKTK